MVDRQSPLLGLSSSCYVSTRPDSSRHRFPIWHRLSCLGTAPTNCRGRKRSSETSESWQPNIAEQPRAQPVIAQSDKDSDGEPLEVNSIHATIESDSPTAIGAVSQPVSIRWVSAVRLALILTGTVW